MASLSGPIDKLGATVLVKVMQSPQRVEALKKQNMPFAGPIVVSALLDTGASCSCLDRRVIGILGLESRGSISILTPSTGPAYVERGQFDATLVLGEGQDHPLARTLPVIETDLGEHSFLALIGRDLLSSCILTFDGPANRFEITF
jgi:hypothetical protein